ncbi:AraC family transcriptional regulator, partial [Priestia megaterium]
FDPLLNSEEQRIWIKMLEGENLIPIKNWLYEKFTNFPNGYPEPELIRISLTSILAQIRRHMKSYRLEKNQALEEQYQNIFNIVLNSPVLFKVVQELLLFIDKILEQVKTQQKNTQNDFIELGLRFIDEHFSRTDLNLIVVADYVNKSPSYFSYVLSQRTSQTFQQYLTNVRINKAKHLLSTTSLSIQQISFSIGFSDPNYFSRVFKNQTGVSPSTWKNQIFI